MAKQQGPKGQFMTMMLLFICIYMGMQLLNPNKGPVDTRPYTDVLKELRKLNLDEKDVEAAAMLPLYNTKINQAKTEKKWTQVEFDQHELEGIVLVAHAKFKGALSRAGDPTKTSVVHKKLHDAWTMMQPHYQKSHNLPLWISSFEVAQDSKLKTDKVSASSLYDNIVTDLSARNHTEMVWGLFQGYPAIDAFVRLTGSQPGFSYWFAAFLLAFAVRLVIYPWSMKQYRFGRQMMQMQPYVKEIQEKFKDKKTGKIPTDKQAQASAETMGLYKEYGLNPLVGCSSALLQMPIYMVVLSAMTLYQFEFVKGTFLWMNPDGPHKFMGMNLAPNLGQPDQLLIIIYGVSMLVSQYLMPVTDPTQIKQQRLMGIGVSVMITFFMFGYGMPSAFVLYWVFANILATAQALYAYKMPAPKLEKVQTLPGGVRPKPGFMEKLQNMMEEQAKSAAQPPQEDTKNGKPENRVDPQLFGKSGSQKSRKRK